MECRTIPLDSIWEFVAAWNILDDNVLSLYARLYQSLPGTGDESGDDGCVPPSVDNSHSEPPSWDSLVPRQRESMLWTVKGADLGTDRQDRELLLGLSTMTSRSQIKTDRDWS